MRKGFDSRDLIGREPALARWLPPVIVMGVLGAFVTLAWFAYHAGTQSLKDDDLLVVEADKTPIKEKPADPGGMKFPNQDKTVFDTFAGSDQQPPKVETIVPAPEEPMPKTADASGTTGWINEKRHSQDVDNAPEQAPARNADQAPEQMIAADEKKAPPVPAPAATPPVEDVPVAAVKHEEIKKTPEKPVAVVHTAPAKPVASSAGGVKVQLGAYRSDKEARAAWDKMLAQHSSLAGRTPIVVKADLGAKGIYYRLRIGGFASAGSAKAFCDKLSASGQACLLAN